MSDTTQEVGGLRSRIVTTYAELRDIGPAWNDALRPGLAPTAMPQWTQSLWLHHRAPGLEAAVVYDAAGRLRGVLPYAVEQDRLHRTTLRALLDIEPAVVPGGEAPVVDALMAVIHVRHRTPQIVMDQVDLSRETSALLVERGRRQGRRVEVEETHRTTLVHLDNDFDRYRGGLSRNTRETLRKARARLAREGASVDLRVEVGVEGVTSAFDEVLAIDSASWKTLRGGAMASKGTGLVYGRVLQGLAERGAARVHVLHIAGKPAAFIFGVIDGGTASLDVWSHREDLAYFYPGWVTMEESLRSLASDGVRTVDFWGRPDRLKRAFGTREEPRHQLRFGRWNRHLNNVATTLRRPVVGRPDRYRLRHDEPAWVERVLLRPLGATSRQATALLLPATRTPKGRAPGIERRRASAQDGVTFAVPIDRSSGQVVTVYGKPVSYVESSPLWGGRAVRVDRVVVACSSSGQREVEATVAAAFADTRWLFWSDRAWSVGP